MRVQILDEAQQDLIEGYHFYEGQEEGLGDYFLDSLFSDIDSLQFYAGIHPVFFGYHRLLSKRFPTNLSGGLLARGHPLGATGMVQVAENHRMLLDTRAYQMALAHSIGGPINNNVVTLLEKTDHFEQRDHWPFKPIGLPQLAQMKPKGMALETVFGERDRVKARFGFATTRFNRSGEPLNSIVLLEHVNGHKGYEFLIGTGPGL